MVKVCETQFPIGSSTVQRSAGFYINNIFKDNLDILARAIAKDMMFTLLISGDGWVRVGKSVLGMQIGTYLTHEVNKLHKVNNVFSLKNIVFTSSNLIDRAFELPKYSVIILDEGDDLTEAHWTSLSKNLARFFRKCGQLNLFIILLIPDFFELPRPYAVTRTVCLINVYFEGEFERGQFQFHGFNSKRLLYKKGKKYGDYKAQRPEFVGNFTNFYTIDEQAYRKKKFEDLQVDTGRASIISENDVERVKKEYRISLLKKLEEFEIDMTKTRMAEFFEVSPRTIHNHFRDIKVAEADTETVH